MPVTLAQAKLNVQTDLDAQVIDTTFRWSDHNPVCLDFSLK